jgi:hypothetical protein
VVGAAPGLGGKSPWNDVRDTGGISMGSTASEMPG